MQTIQMYGGATPAYMFTQENEHNVDNRRTGMAMKHGDQTQRTYDCWSPTFLPCGL